MTELNPYIFRAYDVRGKVDVDITPPVFELVGRAYGTLVRRRGGRTVAIGMDNRVSSTALKEGFVTVHNDGALIHFEVRGGFADVTPQGFTLLAEHAAEAVVTGRP